MNADASQSWELKSKFKVNGYPTIIFASEGGSEITRIVGARDEKYFLGAMKSVLKEQGRSFDAITELANKRDDFEAAYQVGLIYLAREEYPDAHYYLTKASHTWKKGDPRNNKLLEATLGLYSRDTDTLEGKTRYSRLLKDAISWFPHTEEAFQRSAELVRISDSLDDKEGKKEGLNEEIKFAQYYLKHPADILTTDESVSGLYEAMGEAYDELGEKEKYQEAFKKAAISYLADIKSQGLDENSERAYNLERIYCMWKSGDTQLARTWYEKLEMVYPKEFTFYYQHAKLLQNIGNYKEASDRASKAVEFSYGDNKLRVLGLMAEIYNSLKEKNKALKVLDEGISQAQLPADKTIRTYRYYDKLKSLRKKIEGV